MAGDLLKAFIIGICASAPLGPVALLVMQKTLKHGQRGGFITSQGASLIDTAYAAISLLALGVVQDFLDNHQHIVLFSGGLLILIVGLFMLRGIPPKPKKGNARLEATQKLHFGWSIMAQAVATGISNPGAILVHLTLFTFFGIEANGFVHSVLILGMVLLGTELYWFVFTVLINKGRKRISMNTVRMLIITSGYVVIGFGLAFILNGVLSLHNIP